MNKLVEMQTLVAVVDEGSLARAARRLNTTKSVVTDRMKRVEQRLGVGLLERTRPVRATVAGRVFYEHSRRILAEVSQAESAVSDAQASLRGTLRIACPMAFGATHLSALLAKFSLACPDLWVDVELSERQENLHSENFDLAIRLGHLQDSGLLAQTLTVNRHVICASPAYLEKMGTPQTPDDLAQHDGLMYSNREPQGIWQLPVDGALQPFRLRKRLRSDSAHHLLEGAKAGLGLAILPTFIAATAIAQRELEIVLPAHPPSGGQVSAVYRRAQRGSPKIQALVSFLARQIGSPPFWDAAIEDRLP